VEVAGGAVEARWDLRDPDGVRIAQCASTRVAWLRFALSAIEDGADPCAADPGCRFRCDLKAGATRFVIPPGDYAMALEPQGEDGLPLGPGQGVVTPAPVTRRVVNGQVTDLSVNLIIVTP
jgi:hypothetical protein